MGIFMRCKDIIEANANAVCEKLEDPSKMADQTIFKLENDLSKVKAETAAVMANAKATERKLNECMKEKAELDEYAKKALLAGNENDAREFLCKKSLLETKIQSLQQSYEVAKANADKMRQMHDKICADIAVLSERRDVIKANNAVAKANEHFNKMTTSTSSITSSISAFDRWEEKANKRLETATALTELNSQTDSITELKAKYTLPMATDSNIDDEISRLKTELGL